MADLSYTLTLTSANTIGAGSPYSDCTSYTVEYTSGSTYYAVNGGSPASLPLIGSTASVTIPSASYSYLAFKLTSTCAPCNGTSFIYTLTGSAPSTCCTPTLISAVSGAYFVVTGSNKISGAAQCFYTASYVTLSFDTGSCSSALPVSYTTLQYRQSGSSTWIGVPTSSFTGSATSPNYYFTQAAGNYDYRIQTVCSGSVTSSYSNSVTGPIFGDGCCSPVLNNLTPSGSITSSLFLEFNTLGAGIAYCSSCSYLAVQSSSDAGTTWQGWLTASISASGAGTTTVKVNAPPTYGQTYYYRAFQVCGSVTGSSSWCNNASGYYTQTYTPPVTYALYEADEYDCISCTNQGTLVVAFPTSYTSSVQIGKFYKASGFAGFSYNIIQATGSGGPGVIMDTGSNYTTCAGACI